MKILVAGNSHLIGFKDAADSLDISPTYIPIPLCKNFEEVVSEGAGRFVLEAGWPNMCSGLTARNIDLEFDLTQPNNQLVFVGMRLFGFYTTFLPLCSAKSNLPFIICPGDFDIPFHERYLVVSESCLRQVFIRALTVSILNYQWLFQRFDRVFWVPSPPSSEKFAIDKFLSEHRWFIASGLYVRYISIFNECMAHINDSAIARSARITFLMHPMKCLNLRTGFLLEEYSFNPNLPDMHASKEYYSRIVKDVV